MAVFEHKFEIGFRDVGKSNKITSKPLFRLPKPCLKAVISRICDRWQLFIYFQGGEFYARGKAVPRAGNVRRGAQAGFVPG